MKIRTLDRKAVTDPETAGIRLRGRSSDEIPFGAKAMLEDPDVEGVWNSRASTPLQSPVLEPRKSSPSRNPFSRSRRNSSISSLSHLNLPDGESPNRPAESDSIPPSNLDGTPTSTAPLFSHNSFDTSWQYNVPAPYAHNETFPRRRSVTIRATTKPETVAERNTQCKWNYTWSFHEVSLFLTLSRPTTVFFYRNQLKTERSSLDRSHTCNTDSRTAWKNSDSVWACP